jgi:hypothetical protein
MKKNILYLAISVLIMGNLYAKSESEQFVCSYEELSGYLANRYIDTGLSGRDGKYSPTIFDTQTVKIDRKQKTIEVWEVQLSTVYGREEAKKLSPIMERFGSMKLQKIYNYKSMTVSSKQSVFLNCDGSLIASLPGDHEKFQSIPPDSLNEAILKMLIKKYDLK